MIWLVRLCAFLWLASAASAHEIRPALLQMDEVAPNSFSVLWKVPSTGDRVLDLQPEFEAGFRLDSAGDPALIEGFVVYRYRLTGDKPLPGSYLSIRNLGGTTVDVLANVRLLEGTKHTFLLHPKSNSAVIPQAPSVWSVIATYTRLGIEHILFGVDHLLFVASLMLVVRSWPMLLKTVTAFTVAHSITLALAVFGLVTLPAGPVEAMVALSILLVCVEAVRLRRGEDSLAIRWPWVVAFAFGLLHGFGFAGTLVELGLPQGDVPLALLFFNIGVEVGQLIFIAAILAVAGAVRTIVAVPRWAPIAMCYAIGTLAAFWVIERIDRMFFHLA